MDVPSVSALVTGGTSGLGQAVATLLVERGARVSILGRSHERGARIARLLGPRAMFTPADVLSPAAVEAAVAAAVAEFGRLNVLVNCAGVTFAARTLRRSGPASLDDFARVVQVNLVGTYNCIRLAAAAMAATAAPGEAERGVIVSTASIAAFEGQAGQAAYAASKGGIVSMTAPLAAEFAEVGIRVVTIAPGLFETPMLASLPERVRASMGDELLLPRRFGRPEEYAGLVLHVIENARLDGVTIRLDGALRMG